MTRTIVIDPKDPKGAQRIAQSAQADIELSAENREVEEQLVHGADGTYVRSHNDPLPVRGRAMLPELQHPAIKRGLRRAAEIAAAKQRQEEEVNGVTE